MAAVSRILRPGPADMRDHFLFLLLGWCPDSEVRIIMRRARLRTSESKDTSILLT
jgi:hypothetical protein